MIERGITHAGYAGYAGYAGFVLAASVMRFIAISTGLQQIFIIFKTSY
jgi:hypothetical protein